LQNYKCGPGGSEPILSTDFDGGWSDCLQLCEAHSVATCWYRDGSGAHKDCRYCSREHGLVDDGGRGSWAGTLTPVTCPSWTCPFSRADPTSWLVGNPPASSETLPDGGEPLHTSDLQACFLSNGSSNVAAGMQDAVTHLVWAAEETNGCGGGLASQVLSEPTPAALISLLDFGGAGGLTPAGLMGNGVLHAYGGADGGSIWTVDFSSGAFAVSSPINGTHASTRCVAGPRTDTTISSACDTSGDCWLTNADGGALDALVFHDASDAGPASWDKSGTICHDLNDNAGASGYRLPTYKELATLVNFTGTPTGSDFIDGLHGNLGSDSGGLTTLGTKTYWSSTPTPDDDGGWAMVIHFGNPEDGGLGSILDGAPSSGGPQPSTLDNEYSVMCVRSTGSLNGSR